MKKITLFILIAFSFKCYSQSSAKKFESKNTESFSKNQKITDTVSNTFKAQNKPVLSHFGIKTKVFLSINDSIILKSPKSKSTKIIKPKLLMYSKNDSNNN